MREGPLKGSSTMMTTGTGTTVTDAARGIGPWIGGSEAAALTGGDPTAATGRITTEGERPLATGATSGAGKARVFS